MPEQTTVISVRGDARLEVLPDCAELSCEVRVAERHRVDAVSSGARAVEALQRDLADLGGVVITAGARPALGWVTNAISTYEDHERENVIVAVVGLRIEVRDFGMLERLAAALAQHEALNLRWVGWSVDHDNPAWPQVRAAAIRAALQKGRDYAAALGGSVTSVEHVADSGLLGTEGEHGVVFQSARGSARAESAAPSLDPEPQELSAVIEARVVATVPPLT